MRLTIFKLTLLSWALCFANLSLAQENSTTESGEKVEAEPQKTLTPTEKAEISPGEQDLAYSRPRVTLGLLPSYIFLSGDLENYGGSVPAFSLAFKKTGFGGWGENFPIYWGVFEAVSYFSTSNDLTTELKRLDSGYFLLGLEFLGTKPQLGFEIAANFGLGLYVVNTKDTLKSVNATTKESKTKAAPFFGLSAGYRVIERLSVNFALSFHRPAPAMTYTQWQLGAWVIL